MYRALPRNGMEDASLGTMLRGIVLRRGAGAEAPCFSSSRTMYTLVSLVGMRGFALPDAGVE